MEMKVYIVNIDQSSTEFWTGAWFTLPLNLEDMKEKIGLSADSNSTLDECEIVDYELPFDPPIDMPVSELNHLCEIVRELEGSSIYAELKAIQKVWFNSLEELLYSTGYIITHIGCASIADVARYYVEETDYFDDILELLQGSIDYEKLGSKLEATGKFLVTSHGIFEYRG